MKYFRMDCLLLCCIYKFMNVCKKEVGKRGYKGESAYAATAGGAYTESGTGRWFF